MAILFMRVLASNELEISSSDESLSLNEEESSSSINGIPAEKI